MTRTALEWVFKDVRKYFTFINSSRKLCLKHAPAGLLYIVAVILFNFSASLYGSQSSIFLDCQLLNLEEYIQATQQS